MRFPSIDAAGLRGWLDGFFGWPRYRRWAALASAVWTVLVTCYAIGFMAVSNVAQARGTVFVDAMFFLIALALPLLMIWLAAYLAEELERQRAIISSLAELASPMISSLEGLGRTLQEHGPASPQDLQRAVEIALVGHGRSADQSGALAELSAGQQRLERAVGDLAVLARERPVAPPANEAPQQRPSPRPQPRVEARASEQQPSLPTLQNPEPSEDLEWSDLVRALDFPRDADDREGFRALRAALRRRNLALMLQAAEDVLNILSQEGIFMDTVPVSHGTADDWRRFIAGGRGPEVEGMGGIRDEEVLATTRALIKSDPVFRDTALFFHRRFDVILAEYADGVGDDEIMQIADTRSGRAFMLLVRLSGSLGG